MSPEEKLGMARSRLLTVWSFYGHVSLQLRFLPSEMPWLAEPDRTMGVRILGETGVECLYYPPFVQKLPISELAVVIQHEIEHVIRLHCVRRAHRDPVLYNVAADMCVNGPWSSPRIGLPDRAGGRNLLPLGGKIIWIPTTWPHDLTAEAYYERLNALTAAQRKDLALGALADDHSVWEQSTVTLEEARQTVHTIVREAEKQSRGRVPCHLTEAIARLQPPVIPWQSLLHQYLGRHLGGRRRTWARADRRRPGFGRPGVSRHAGGVINIVVDTSGSVSPGMLERFFSEIDRVSRHARIFVLHWDTAYQGYGPYRPGDWRSLTVRGRGGTDMASAFRWLGERGQRAETQILLTDGYTNWPDPGPYRFIAAIASKPSRVRPPEWGHAIYMGE